MSEVILIPGLGTPQAVKIHHLWQIHGAKARDRKQEVDVAPWGRGSRGERQYDQANNSFIPAGPQLLSISTCLVFVSKLAAKSLGSYMVLLSSEKFIIFVLKWEKRNEIQIPGQSWSVQFQMPPTQILKRKMTKQRNSVLIFSKSSSFELINMPWVHTEEPLYFNDTQASDCKT